MPRVFKEWSCGTGGTGDGLTEADVLALAVKPDYEAAESDAAGILNKPDLTQSETFNVDKAAAGEYVQGVSRILWNGHSYILNTDAALQAARGNTDTVDQTVLPSAGDGSDSSDWVRQVIDQAFKSESANAQSGVAIHDRIATIDPRQHGVTFLGYVDDTAAWQSIITMIEGMAEWTIPRIQMPYGRTRITDRLVFPNLTDLRGQGSKLTQIYCVGANAGIAFSNYDLTGVWGAVSVGSVKGCTGGGFEVSADGAQTGALMHVGLGGMHNFCDINTRRGGAGGLQIYGAQDSQFKSMVSQDNAGWGLELNRGAANNHIDMNFAAGNDLGQLLIGSMDTTNAVAFRTWGPSRNRITIEIDFTSEGVPIQVESGRDNTIMGGRLNYTDYVNSFPMVSVVAPTETLDADRLRFIDMIFRSQTDSGAFVNKSYVIQNDSPNPVSLMNCQLENMLAFPCFRGAGDVVTVGLESLDGAVLLPANLKDIGAAGTYQKSLTDVRHASSLTGPVIIDRTTGLPVRVIANNGSLALESV